MSPWRLILDSECDPAWNMALDEAILEAVSEGVAPPTLRLFRWNVTAVSIGRFQDVARGLRMESIAARGIPIVRRPTGGRGVLHGGDQTYSVAAPLVALGRAGQSVIESYRRLAEPLEHALNRLGIRARIGRSFRPVSSSGDCFASRTRADLQSAGNGEKLVGSAQRRRGGFFLQQSSLIHRPSGLCPDEVFVGSVGRNSYPLESVDDDVLRDAIAEGFQEVLGLTFSGESLSEWERGRAESIMTDRLLVNTLGFVDSRTGL